MTATTFNALAYAQRLRGAGVPEPQAEAQAAALDDAFRQNAGDFATKRDIADLKAELKSDMEKLGMKLTIRLGGMMAVAVGVVVALVKLL